MSKAKIEKLAKLLDFEKKFKENAPIAILSENEKVITRVENVETEVETIKTDSQKIVEAINELDQNKATKTDVENALASVEMRKGDRGFKGEKGDTGAKGAKGDKGDKGDTTIVDRVIERTEVIKEIPIVTENVVEKITEEVSGETLVERINLLPQEEEYQIDATHIKNLPKPTGGNFNGISGIKEIVAGSGISVDNSNLGYPIVSAPGSTTDEKVKYDVNDPTAKYLSDIIVAGTGITLSEGIGADENKLKITNSLDLSGYVPLDQTTPSTFTNLGGGTGLMKVTAGLLGLDTSTYLDTTTAGTTYLKLDQTTPQTTVGTFTFPATVVNNQSAFGTTIDSTLQLTALGAAGSTNVAGKGFKFLSGGSGLNSDGTLNLAGTITLQGGIGQEETNAPAGTANGGGGGRLIFQPGNGGKITRVSGAGSVTGGAGGTINYQAGTGGIALASSTTNAIGGTGSVTTFNSGAPGTGAGGAATATTSGTNTGGVGASFLFNTKAGGLASGGATSTGGASGSAKFILAVGGAATSSAGKAGVGGAGGELTFQGGTGGAATGAGTTNTGGAGTTVTFQAGVGGAASGASTNTAGANGNIIFKSGSTEVGRFDNTAGAVGNFRLTLDNQQIQLGTAQDFIFTFTGSQGQIQSDAVTATDSLLLRGGTGGMMFNIGATEMARLTATGLGIGTTPSKTFQVGTTLYVDNSTGQVGINTTPTGTHKLDINFTGTTVGAAFGDINGEGPLLYYGSDGTLPYINSRNNHGLAFWTNNSEKMRIDTSGNVGIGTTAALRRLDINEASGNCLRLIYNDSDGSAANYVDFLVSSTGDLTITPSGGDISIGSAILTTTGSIDCGATCEANAYTVGGVSGIDATVPVAPVAPATIAGSMTFVKGILTAYTAPS